ncbi:MAG: radical SAM protein [Defluviitaleaceae bacterium]|nr:radical SAM protein [Defluviitaleaceae bacterium]
MTAVGTKSLGPYNRYAIWVQGCQKVCPGCISPDSRPLQGGYEADVTALAGDIAGTPGIEGMTISGGEPFLQWAALSELITLVKGKRDLGVIVYTGMMYDEIMENKLAKACDLIIDGEYREGLDDGLSLRGSSNQKLHLITQRYAGVTSMYGAKGRKIEFHIKGDRTTMVGIPNKDTIKKLMEA